MNTKRIIDWSILLMLSITWGSSFILMKKSLIKFTYLEVGLYRLIIAFVILSPFLISTFKKIQKQHIIPLLIISLIGTVIPAIIFAKAQIYIKSSFAGMLNSLTPMFTLILGILLFNKSHSIKNIIGVLISLFGTYILLHPTQDNSIDIKYSLMIIIATICYALSINTIKEKLKSLKSLEIAVMSAFLSAFIPCVYIIQSGILFNMEKIYNNFSHFYYLIILGGLCTSFAIILFNYLIKRSTALFASSTTYLIPIFAIIWGVIDVEIINIHELIGVAIILTGVFIMNKQN